MIPGNVDPRRPEKVQRYKPPQANGNPPVEDLTPDYMNILGPDSATANAEASEIVKSAEPQQQTEDPSTSYQEPAIQTSNGTNVIPTSPQYGVAIISNDVPSETTTSSTDTVVETTAKSEGDNKDMHSTPSRNDRFKVVKIASLEPFRRGRWKCMDYVDENPPPTTTQSKSSQSTSNLQMGGNIYMQTQSLPQQHFQQMLVQGAFTNPQQFYNLPSQMMPQSQYFYPTQNVTNMQQLPVQPNAIQPQFINANQQYFNPNVVPHSAGYNYNNVQYVPTNLIQNQSSAFVPTTQNVNPQLPSNFQQSQTYAGSGTQPMVNGHAYPPMSESQVVVASSLPTQVAKNVILSANITNPTQITQAIQPIPNIPQSQVNVVQNQYSQVTNPGYQSATLPPTNTPQQNITQVPTVVSTVTPVIPIISAQSVNQIPTSQVNQVPSQIPTSVTISTQSAPSINLSQMPNIMQQSYDPNLPTNVYTNPQFVASVNSLPVAENSDAQGDSSETNAESESVSGEDPAKANPVVNAIDNKIEQAMDLVKSHLMYTVREEVEVLKEKIAELMERIQQLETENSFLKQQIPKGPNSNPSGTPDPPQ